MTASDYPINFPYGATVAPYSPTHPHRGDDHPCPAGTPLVINGITLGLTGATGFVSGPHLHIQEWQNDYANTRKPQNAFKPGTVVNIDPSGTQGDGSFGKFITIQTADGWNDSYCHLSQINVTVGQKIGDSMANTLATLDEVNDLCVGMLGLEASTNQNFLNNVGIPISDAIRNIFHYQEAVDFRNRASAAAEELKPGTYIVK